MRMKRILMSLFAVAAVAAVAGVGSSAYWQDVETSTNNIFSAGELTLQFSEDGTDWQSSVENGIIDEGPTFPGDSGDGFIYVRNWGNTVDGKLSIQLSNVVDNENGLVDQEVAYDTTPESGELCGKIQAKWILYDPADITTPVASTNWKYLNTSPTWDFGGNAILTKDGKAYALTGLYKVDTDAGNEIMTDKCEFSISGILEQVH